MFVHSVYFWLKEDLAAEQIDCFENGLHALDDVETVRHCFIGKPADTDRPVVDRSYSYALTVVFDDKQGHDVYQVHELHKKFLSDCSSFWNKILIYDAV